MNTTINHFSDLEAWKKAYSFTIQIYQLTKSFPKEERFGIISQLQRAACSITANIAEGFSRYHYKDKTRFYYQARASLSECQNFLIISKGLKYINNDTYTELYKLSIEIIKLINGLINSQKSRS